METSQVEITDLYGKLNVWNISTYTILNTIHDELPQNLFRRLNLIGDNFDLEIHNLSFSDDGLYVCGVGVNCVVQQQLYILQHKCKFDILP